MVFSEQRALKVGADEILRRGQDIYQTQLRARLDTPENLGKFLAIDIDTGDFAVGGRLDAAQGLREKHPDSLICILKIGYSAAVTMSGRLLSNGV